MAENTGAGSIATVLGPIDADQLGITAVGEALLSVYPGAQYGYDITINRAEIYQALKTQVLAFKEAGGSTIVDTTGMFHGRDVYMYESLQEATGVNIVASTGLGPERLLGGYFLTPQTNPPTPWPAEKFAELFGKELSDGMVVPRIERRHPAGIVSVVGSEEGLTPTDESLFTGAARAASANDRALMFNYAKAPQDAVALLTREGLAAQRILVAQADRRDAPASELARAGAFVGLNNVGSEDPAVLNDDERAALIVTLISEGLRDRIILSTSTTGHAVGHPDRETGYAYLLTGFVDKLRAAGIADTDITAILVDNPRALLAGK